MEVEIMRVEVRNDKIIVDGYVNAVERASKVLYDTRGQFIEKIRSGVFQRALEKTDNVKVLLDHEYDRELADTKSGKAKLYEDNIGLRAIVEIEDSEVIQKAKETFQNNLKSGKTTPTWKGKKLPEENRSID